MMAPLLALWAALPLGAQELPAYKFTLNDLELFPQIISLNYESQPQAGDLAMINGIMVTLGEPGTYAFHVPLEQRERLYLAGADGKRTLHGVRVTWAMRAGEKVLVNPLPELEAEELAGLRGVFLDYWDDTVAKRIGQLDPQKTCVTVTDLVALGETRALPAFPANLRALAVYEKHGGGFSDYGSLRKLTKLEFFAVISYGHPALDMELFTGMPALKYLDLSATTVQRADALARCPALRSLNLGFTRGVKDVAFAKALSDLRVLDVQQTEVSDLSPLSEHANLRFVLANRSPIKKLPEGKLPALQGAELLKTPLSEADVAQFRQTNPNAVVLFQLDKLLAESLKRCDRMRVRSLLPSGKIIEKPALEVADTAVLLELGAQVHVDMDGEALECACSTGPFLEFMQKDQIVVTVAFRHNKQAEWLGGVLGNWPLRNESIQFLVSWLGKHDVKVEDNPLPGLPNPLDP
ncbi:MAG: hypothetical protein HS116_02835 [Planctomycetes bacterium]|nr:hypothetical protein [Planctomycetota bacterium]